MATNVSKRILRVSKLTKQHSPKCAYPGCRTHVCIVKYKNSGTPVYRTVCSRHHSHKQGKAAVNKWKLSRGCETHGCKCNTTVASGLTIDHNDGNKFNIDPANIVIRCASSHNIKTQENEDWKQNYTNRLFPHDRQYDGFFEVVT